MQEDPEQGIPTSVWWVPAHGLYCELRKPHRGAEQRTIDVREAMLEDSRVARCSFCSHDLGVNDVVLQAGRGAAPPVSICRYCVRLFSRFLEEREDADWQKVTFRDIEFEWAEVPAMSAGVPCKLLIVRSTGTRTGPALVFDVRDELGDEQAREAIERFWESLK